MSDHPWPMRTKATTVADLNDGRDLPGLIGPLPLVAAMELIYRVKAVEFDGAYSYQDSGDNEVSGTIAGEVSMSENELEVWESAQFNPADSLPVFTPEMGPVFAPEGNGSMGAINSANADAQGHGEMEIFVDEDGNYWLSGFAQFSAGSGSPGSFAIQTTQSFASGTLLLDITLELQSGSYAIKGIGQTNSGTTVNSASMTITASEWHPYETTAGVAAWNTETGAPVNGGPGA
jgi:hypothetical protein